MNKSYIMINDGETTQDEIRMLISSQKKLAKLLELSEVARHQKKHPDGSYSEAFLAQVRKIIS